MPGQAGFISTPPKPKDESDDDAIEGTPSGRNRAHTRSKSLVPNSESSSKRIAQFAATITVSFQFRVQLVELMDKLRQTVPHYVKCIKPNNVKAPGACSKQLIMQQLRYSGVLEVVRIRREGYPTREEFVDFYKKFKILAWGKGWPHPDACTEEQSRAYATALAAENLPSDAFQIGTNRMFFKQQALHLMQVAVRKFFDDRATKIQVLSMLVHASVACSDIETAGFGTVLGNQETVPQAACPYHSDSVRSANALQ
jgi:myosin heavy subunit